jgi:hypothetical protein
LIDMIAVLDAVPAGGLGQLSNPSVSKAPSVDGYAAYP